MRVIEVGSRVCSTERVAESRAALYGALRDHGYAVHILRSSLVLAVPVQSRFQAG